MDENHTRVVVETKEKTGPEGEKKAISAIMDALGMENPFEEPDHRPQYP